MKILKKRKEYVERKDDQVKKNGKGKIKNEK